MSAFKDFLKSDLDIFINLDEFADYHKINDKEIKCIMDSDIFDERSTTKSDARSGGVYEDSISLFVKMEDIEKQSISEILTVDGEDYKVIKVTESEKLFEIQLMLNTY